MVICHGSYRKQICPSSKSLLAQFFVIQAQSEMSCLQRNCPWLLQLSKYFLNESLKMIHLTLIKVEARALKLTTMGWIQPAHVSYLTDTVFENLRQHSSVGQFHSNISISRITWDFQKNQAHHSVLELPHHSSLPRPFPWLAFSAWLRESLTWQCWCLC